ncbi:MAG: hypothetical protein RI564_07525 [Gracilimonas sp.]|nr:hypothetical protein [Gracilimonas sp.]
MSNNLKAFEEPIEEGLVRILLRISSVICEIENDAPDFVTPEEDKPHLVVKPQDDIAELTKVFTKSYPLMLNDKKSKGKKMVWKLKKGGIWFDIEMDSVKDIWLTEFNFFIESERPRYLKYYIQDIEHKVQWLQKDVNSGEIRSLSEFKKKFTPPPISEKEVYSGNEILKCADMLSRAISKIDMRTKQALVKFNTDKGRLEPLIIGMGDKLGYKISALDKETMRIENEKGNNVSHTIALK